MVPWRAVTAVMSYFGEPINRPLLSRKAQSGNSANTILIARRDEGMHIGN